MRKNQPLVDNLYDQFPYRDTGCDLHPACLTCPLPRCRYDEPIWRGQDERGERDSEIVRMRTKQALSIQQLAVEFGVSTRTVHRILRKGKAGAAASRAA